MNRRKAKRPWRPLYGGCAAVGLAMGGGLLTVPDVGQSAPAEATVSGVEPSRIFTPYTGKSGTGMGLGGTQRKSPYGYSP